MRARREGGSMPSDFRYLDDSDVYVTVYWGPLSTADILDTILKRSHDSDLKAAKAHVVDLADAVWSGTEIPHDHATLERMRPAFAPPKLRTAFVAPGDFVYGLALMYALFHAAYSAARVDVHRTWGEAAAALDIPLASAEAWARERIAAGS